MLDACIIAKEDSALGLDYQWYEYIKCILKMQCILISNTAFISKRHDNFDLTRLDNTMTLCGDCHAAFNDGMNPSFVFVPSDLEVFHIP